MSGLKRRLSRRRSAGPEGTDPSTAAAPGSGDAPDQTPAEAEGHTSLLNDPAARTRIVQPGEASYAQPGAYPPGDPGASAYPQPAAGAYPAAYPQPPAGAYPQPYPVAPVGDYPRPGPGTPQPAYFTTGASVPGAPYSVRDPADPDASPFADLPPGLDPDELSDAPATSARRSRLRKRVAFLRAARELLMRDLGGFVYELHRTASDIESEAHRGLRATKLDRLTRLDAELHALELRLNDVRRNVIVREPGVGGECPQCGELFGSDDHYCAHCGLPLTESARRALARIMAAGGEPPAAVPAAPHSVLVRPGEVPRAGADQATQPIPPLDAGAGSEFHWPPRTPAPGDEPTAVGAPAASAKPAGGDEPAASATPDVEPNVDATTGHDETAQGDAAPGSDDAPTSGAAPGSEAPDGDPAPGGEAAAGSSTATGDADAGAEVGDGDAAPSGDAAATGDEAHGADAPASDDTTATGDATASDETTATGGDEPSARGGQPSTGDAASEPERKDDDGNGRGGLFSRAERGA